MSHEALSPDQFFFVRAASRTMSGPVHHKVEVPSDKPDEPHGWLYWHHATGEIGDIRVHPDRQRQGLATAMYQKAKEIASTTRGVKPPKHSPDRTDEGEAWARSLGEPLPEREQ